MFIQELVGYDVAKTIIITIATISLVVFVALFGRLPVFRSASLTVLKSTHQRLTPGSLDTHQLHFCTSYSQNTFQMPLSGRTRTSRGDASRGPSFQPGTT